MGLTLTASETPRSLCEACLIFLCCLGHLVISMAEVLSP
jgi:hypothetical protein